LAAFDDQQHLLLIILIGGNDVQQSYLMLINIFCKIRHKMIGYLHVETSV